MTKYYSTMKKFLLGLMAAACILTSCDLLEELEDELTDNQEPTMVDSKDGMKTTVSFKVAGVVEYSYVVDYMINEKGDTVCKSATSVQKYFLQTLADQAWEEVLAAKAMLQEELDRINSEIRDCQDEEKLEELRWEADLYRTEIENFDASYVKDGKTITYTDTDISILSKMEMKEALEVILEDYQILYKKFKAMEGKE